MGVRIVEARALVKACNGLLRAARPDVGGGLVLGRGRGGFVCRTLIQRRGDVVEDEKAAMHGFFDDGVIPQPAALFKQRQQARDGARVVNAVHAPVDVFILLVTGKIGGDGRLFAGDAVEQDDGAGDGGALFGRRFHWCEEFPGAGERVGFKAHQRGIFAAVVEAEFDVGFARRRRFFGRVFRRVRTGEGKRKQGDEGGAARQNVLHGRTQCNMSSGTRRPAR